MIALAAADGMAFVVAQETRQIVAAAEWRIGLVGQLPDSRRSGVVSDRMENVPDRIFISRH